jgi:hypothetical protein
MSTACLAIYLVNPKEPQEAGSYLWCIRGAHPGRFHLCYSGLRWHADDVDLVQPTPEMILWRTGAETDVKRVSGHMLG